MKLKLITDNRDAATGMRLAGIEYSLAFSSEECEKAINGCIADGETGIILVTQELYEKYADFIDSVKKTVNLPLITEIPDSDGNFKNNAITRYVSDAMGI